MKLTNCYSYVPLTRATSEAGREYIQPDGNRVSSVTTILSATADKTNLLEWQKRVGLAEATRIRNEAASLGTLMHTHLESHIQNLPRPPGTNLIRQLATAMSDQIINRGLVNVDEIWGMEAPLYYPNLYAGTADLIGVYKGKPAIMDYKTTNKMKTREMIEDYSLQLAAYAMAHNELFETAIQTGVIFMVSRTLEYKEFIFEADELEGCKERWIARLEQFLSQRRLLEPALV